MDPRYAGWTAPAYKGQLLRRAAVRALWPALAAVVIAVAVNRTIEIYGDRLFGGRSDRASAARTTAPEINRLVRLEVRVVPPAYSHLPSQVLTEPSTISGLVGGQIVVHGRGDTMLAFCATVRGEVRASRCRWLHGVDCDLDDAVRRLRFSHCVTRDICASWSWLLVADERRPSREPMALAATQ